MTIDNSREKILYDNGFILEKNNNMFNSLGKCFRLDPSIGDGHYWIYTHEDLFAIVIHDFFFHEDFCLESKFSEHFSISYYESVSGEELNPYNKLSAGCVKSYWCASDTYKAIFHKNIPIKSISIEFMPEYCYNFLSNKFAKDYVNPKSALISINETKDFPEMFFLLHQLYNYRGSGISAKLFYEAKVCEAMSLIYENYKNNSSKKESASDEDLERMKVLASYINDHYSFNLTLKQLSPIACMGLTKLKKTFKLVHNCTIIEYIQKRRIGEAEHLLMKTDLTVGQIANIVGYKNASRFTELFKKNTGILPSQYRSLSRKL